MPTVEDVATLVAVLREAVLDGWLACAPASLAEEYLAARPAGRRRTG